jgi:hypothetical protein
MNYEEQEQNRKISFIYGLVTAKFKQESFPRVKVPKNKKRFSKHTQKHKQNCKQRGRNKMTKRFFVPHIEKRMNEFELTNQDILDTMNEVIKRSIYQDKVTLTVEEVLCLDLAHGFLKVLMGSEE